jgi:hypothetical protein
LRCGENVGHINSGSETQTIGQTGYLSMNAAAWQLPRTALNSAMFYLIMVNSAQVPMPLRLLLSQGSSTSAREAVTILGANGHIVEVCDPSRWCLARFSRFVRKFHRCPGLRDDPAGYLAFVEELLAARQFDVLLPTHEQGFLFARVSERLAEKVGLALPSFASYRTAHSKAAFSRLLDEMRLPQPKTHIVKSEHELSCAISFPGVIKTSVGTASRGIWFVRDQPDLEIASRKLNGAGAFADEVLVQESSPAPPKRRKGCFCRGELIGFHAIGK